METFQFEIDASGKKVKEKLYTAEFTYVRSTSSRRAKQITRALAEFIAKVQWQLWRGEGSSSTCLQ